MHHMRILFQKNEYSVYTLRTSNNYHKSPTKHTQNKKVQTAIAYTFNYIIPSTHIIASAWSQHKTPPNA